MPRSGSGDATGLIGAARFRVEAGGADSGSGGMDSWGGGTTACRLVGGVAWVVVVVGIGFGGVVVVGSGGGVVVSGGASGGSSGGGGGGGGLGGGGAGGGGGGAGGGGGGGGGGSCGGHGGFGAQSGQIRHSFNSTSAVAIGCPAPDASAEPAKTGLARPRTTPAAKAAP
ncbi:hypothetical protein [Amycolatopsis sp. YIM 10]|uniref:hypothetical protein n=1 Tax=Amycolatopsis sp. YIM 10 TaxID=2653857 RepID=UPI001883CE2F|nr:hypothetical protein [Amycolatopsis sp. YIM 10]